MQIRLKTATVSRIATLVLSSCILFDGALLAQFDRHSDLASLVEHHAVSDPARFIIDKLCANRIVMIADGGHGDVPYDKVVVDALNDWCSKFETAGKDRPKALPTKLILFLEMDSIRTSALYKYFLDGNPIETVEPMNLWGGPFTTSTLEFYSDLRALKHRVEAFNAVYGTDAPLSFEIVGPEKAIDPGEWTSEKRDYYFTHEQDKVTSAKIREVLESEPDAKAVVFYGGVHLQTANLLKQAGAQKAMGYYLAHYLSDDFAARGGIYLCGQVDVDGNAWLDEAIRKEGKTFAVDQSVFTGVPLDPDASFPPYDGVIYHVGEPRRPRQISTIVSERLVDYILEHIDRYTDSTKEFYRSTLDSWFYYLSTVAVKDWHPIDHRNESAIDSAITAWKNWRKTSRLDVVDDLTSLQYFEKWAELIRTSSPKQSTWHQIQLEKMVGFKVWFQSGASQQVRADSIWGCIKKYRKSIVVENLIQLLWVGSASETEKANAALKSETGMSFNSPKEWSSWWEMGKKN